jgi:hypothetical protein
MNGVIFIFLLLSKNMIMNKTITILTFFLLSQLSFGQITTTKVADKKEKISTVPYDSLQNFLEKDVYKYIGQDLYLKGKNEILRKYGYDYFVIDYQFEGYKNSKNTYKCCDSYNSKYEDLAGKYFNVIAVHKHPEAKENEYLYGAKFYLELIEKESGDKVFFEYDSKYSVTFPFIVVGFFEKVKSIVVGQKFVFDNTILEDSRDIFTGEIITNIPNQRWECIDLTIEEKYYTLSLIVKDPMGQNTTVSYNTITLTDGRRTFREKNANKYEQRFGKGNWLKILDGKVIIGFTEEMVLLSWGKPEDINRSSSGDQWVYDGQYLYFENGILKSFN